MAACDAVCLQEFGEYDDPRIYRSMDLSQLRLPSDGRARLPPTRDAPETVADGSHVVADSSLAVSASRRPLPG